MPFIPPPGGAGNTSLPYWLNPVVSIGILSLGILYYGVFFLLLPWAFGLALRPATIELSDGSHVTRYRLKKLDN